MSVICLICRWIRRKWWHFWKSNHQSSAMTLKRGCPAEQIAKWDKSTDIQARNPNKTYFLCICIDAMGVLDRKFRGRSLGTDNMWFCRNCTSWKWFWCGTSVACYVKGILRANKIGFCWCQMLDGRSRVSDFWTHFSNFEQFFLAHSLHSFANIWCQFFATL